VFKVAFVQELVQLDLMHLLHLGTLREFAGSMIAGRSKLCLLVPATQRKEFVVASTVHNGYVWFVEVVLLREGPAFGNGSIPSRWAAATRRLKAWARQRGRSLALQLLAPATVMPAGQYASLHAKAGDVTIVMLWLEAELKLEVSRITSAFRKELPQSVSTRIALPRPQPQEVGDDDTAPTQEAEDDA
jgi:hypothetical protein